MKKTVALLAFIGLAIGVNAQENKSTKQIYKENKRKQVDERIKKEEEGMIVFEKQSVFGAKLITDGVALFYEMGRAKSIKKSVLYQFEIGEQNALNEYKQLVSNSSNYIYGKINYLYLVKIGAQQQILLANKSNKNGVSISTNFGGGIALGILRAYEVEVLQPNNSTIFVPYSTSTSAAFLGDSVVGGPSLGIGWNHIKLTPGIYLKSALRFDYAKFSSKISALELGIAVNTYAQKIPQMVYNKQQQIFFSAFVAIMFGKRK